MSTGNAETAERDSPAARAPATDAARKRAAVELIRRHERTLKRTARRYSICADDADDAYQRALEILLTKAPTVDVRELIRWMQTVTKHEALAVRRNRERILHRPAPAGRDRIEEQDWVELIPSPRDGPADLVERRERVARSREALQMLKPQELQALTLLAEGYSYVEIGELTGFSHTKINRLLAEGRLSFRGFLSSNVDGSRCDELGPALSAFCDGEAEEGDERMLREHLRACAHCRLKLRTFRAAPEAAAALVPVAPLSRSLFDRAHELFAGFQGRLPGRTGSADSVLTQLASTGGSRGAGIAAVVKVFAVCAGTAGGAAACVAAGIIPPPIDLSGASDRPAHVKHLVDQPPAQPEPPTVPTPVTTQPDPVEQPAPDPTPAPDPAPAPSDPVPDSSPPASTEFTPEAAVSPAPVAPAPASGTGSGTASSGGGGSGAGEFGP